MTSKPVVLSIGEILWDVLPTGKRAGGAPVNFSYHAAKNGAEGYAISAVGRDDLGRELEKAVQEAGVDAVLQHNDHPTSTVEVQLNEGIPQYVFKPDVAWDHLEYTDDLAGLASKADAVCYGTLSMRSSQSRETCLQVLRHTKSHAMRFFDINLRGTFYSKDLIQELLDMATVFKLNDEELVTLRDMFRVPGATDDELCRWFMDQWHLDTIVLTAGNDYSTIYLADGQSSHLPTPEITVADTVGAGDAFSGTFAINRLLGASLTQSHRAAVNTAAFVCTQPGAWPEYPEHIPDYLGQQGQ
ncbi:carbohydrate kinase [Bifidobacterium sp. W8101]|uniref:carbohydrate kinase family protein n=1 Tax=Bifidobacterium TaxID=1678 RepID=UPI0018DC0767|nr:MULTISPECIES: carbohydrate kinase [Bifidobacterium]MBI0125685.1 carbohydrate kinase [Bifidobacterium choladohabitans]MBI0127254.1 carbohydrate kinase [Bifidobacterium sp. W8103]MBI0137842.1 carbohydrate kinase [Bifidobacterium sp. W8105]MBI0149187.1 carbohydrate kinase [Bifidobacterium sp. W8107]